MNEPTYENCHSQRDAYGIKHENTANYKNALSSIRREDEEGFNYPSDGPKGILPRSPSDLRSKISRLMGYFKAFYKSNVIYKL
jgi:hypothetical protein